MCTDQDLNHRETEQQQTEDEYSKGRALWTEPNQTETGKILNNSCFHCSWVQETRQLSPLVKTWPSISEGCSSVNLVHGHQESEIEHLSKAGCQSEQHYETSSQKTFFILKINQLNDNMEIIGLRVNIILTITTKI